MEMTPERWQDVKALFDGAVSLPTGERTVWLAARCGADGELLREVTSLLEAHLTGGDRFEPPEGGLGALLDGPDALAPGARLGPYRVVREVGRGGMGVVYEASRDDDQFRKRVAIKTISRELGGERVLRRFRQEQRILARLEHRNIATLLDGGVSDSGQPYLAMEFVEGRPIDRYCGDLGLDLRARLQLFRQVCSAVQHAHRNLVVHRDLKPGNILVTDDGTVKLLDFGIAKLLDSDGAGSDPELTRTGAAPLTTAYASPEQVAGQPVTTATDVFSLGVVLYELLAGTHPFNRDRPGASEVRRRIQEDDPPPPSASVVDSADRGRHARLLKGDLDSIVLMALRKEPARRYVSVDRLADDLQRFLTGQPVQARPDSVGYRVGKFVRRNRAAVAAATVAVVALVAGLVGTAWQARVAGQERDRARAAAVSAERQRARAEQTSRFLQNMLGSADPSWYSAGERPGPETPISTIFEAAGRRAETDLAASPEVLADVLQTLGRANQALRRPEQARQQLARARELHLAAYGPASVEVANDEHELGMAESQAGNLALAEAWFRRALATFGAAGDSTSDEFGRTLADLGLVVATSGRPAEAEPLIRAASEHRRRFDSASVANAILLGNLGLVLSQQGKLDEAEPVYRAALAAFERHGDREYFERAWTLGNLAVDLLLRGHPAEAKPLAEEQVAVFTRLLGPAHPNVGYGWVNVARVHLAAGDPRRALEAGRKADAIFRGALPPGHPDIARSELVLGQALAGLGDLAGAERLLRSALAIRRGRLAPQSPHTADAAAALAAVLLRQGQSAEAETLLLEAQRTFRAGLGPSDPRTVSARRTLVALYQGQGRAAQAGAWQDSLSALLQPDR